MSAEYQVLIVGGGPIGLAVALAAKEAGLSYLVLEKGCLVNSLYNYPQNMSFFSTSDKLEIGNVPFVSIQAKPTRPEALEYYRRVTVHNRLNIRLQEEVTAIQPHHKGYWVTTRKQEYFGKAVVLATGFYGLPFRMNIPGEELPKVTHYYKDPHFYAMQRVVVVGANNSAVDAALETWRKGAEVTLVVRGPEMGRRVKYWAKPDIENRIKEGSIKAYFNAQLTAITELSVDLKTAEGNLTLPNDYVIAMTGYQPDLGFLQNCGIKLAADSIRKPDYNPLTMETNMPNLYLAGVICGGMDTHSWFIENSREHAPLIINDLLSKGFKDQSGESKLFGNIN